MNFNFFDFLGGWGNCKHNEYKGITQKELAAAINERYNTVQSWINKNRLPNVEQAVKVAKFLDTSVEFLTLGKDVKIDKDNSETIKLLEKAIQNLR